MYAIRSYYAEIFDLKINTGIPDSEFEFEVPEGAEVITVESAPATPTGDFEKPGKVPIEEIKEHAGFEPRITSYNVCYTKLLR